MLVADENLQILLNNYFKAKHEALQISKLFSFDSALATESSKLDECTQESDINTIIYDAKSFFTLLAIIEYVDRYFIEDSASDQDEIQEYCKQLSKSFAIGSNIRQLDEASTEDQIFEFIKSLQSKRSNFCKHTFNPSVKAGTHPRRLV